MSDPRLEAAVKAWDHYWGDRYGDDALEEMGEEVAVALAAADEADLRAGIVRTQQGARITASIIQNALRRAADVMPIETLLGADKASVWLREYAEKWGNRGDQH